MATVMEIIKGLNQVIHLSQDHQYDGLEPPLDREEGHRINDTRVIDGFKATIGGNILGVLYHSEIDLKQTHEKGFEKRMKQKIADIVSFLKKEYKKHGEGTLKLEAIGEPKVLVQKRSYVKTYVQVKQYFKIDGIPSASDENEDEAKKRQDIYDDVDSMLDESRQREAVNESKSYKEKKQDYQAKLFKKLLKKSRD